MKVLLISTIDGYGAPKSFMSLCRLLALENIEVSAVISRKGDIYRTLTEDGITCYWIPFGHNTFNPKKSFLENKLVHLAKWGLEVMADARIWCLIKKEHYDIVHINSSIIDVGSVPAHLCHVKLFRHLREFVEEDFGRKFYNKPKSYSRIALADCVIAVSNAVRNKYISSIEPSKVVVVYNGIDEKNYLPKRKGILQNRDVKIVMVGQLNAGKGHAVLMNALNILKKSEHPIHVAIVGDGEEMDNLVRMACEYGLNEIVEFLGYRSDIPEILRQSDICVVASRMEAFGRITVEAMLAGTLVIGADSAGTTELLADNRGLLFLADNPPDLAEKIMYAINNHLEMQEIAIHAQKYAFENYTASKNAQAVKELYQQFLYSREQ